jgi:uncharacterized protein (TIGR03083 family)
MNGPDVRAFNAASRFLVEVVSVIPDVSWDEPGLGEWSIKELVGHANRAHETIVDYLENPQPEEPAGSPYFDDASIARRGREAVGRLGTNPAEAVAEKSLEVIELVSVTEADATLGSPIRTMTLADYLPSRTTELTVHALDIVRALDLGLEPPTDALRESLAFALTISMRRHQGLELLMAITGRDELPEGFSVY